jgi:hypothetical protein
MSDTVRLPEAGHVMSTGAQWRAEVKAALAASRRQQRQRRGKRTQDASSFPVAGPGMVRINPPKPKETA